MLLPINTELARFYERNAQLGMTARERAATVADIYYLGRQYEGLRDWWDRSVPLRQRKPRIIVPLYRESIDTLDRFTWGGTRFPRAIVQSSSNSDGADDIGPLLTQEQGKELTSFAATLIKFGRLDRAIREASSKAMVTSSSAVIVGAAGGYLATHVEPGKHCTPTFSRQNPREVEKLEILYQYPKEVEQPSGAIKIVPTWYRRTIDTENDTVFQEVPVRQGEMPKWQIDEQKSVVHRLGFCPVQWVRTLPDSSDPIDGRPVIDPTLYPMLDAINYTISQRQRAVEYGMDPQWIRKGVPQADREELNKAPNQIWDIPLGADLNAAEMSLPGAGVATDHLRDLRERFLEACSVVLADPKNVSGNISGVVLEFLHAPMISLASDLRADLGDDAFCGLIGLAMRIVATVISRGETIWIPGAIRSAETLARSQLLGVWMNPHITLEWPPYFSPTIQDHQIKTATAAQARQERLITQATATRYVADVFNITDPQAEQEALDSEESESLKSQKPVTRPAEGQFSEEI